MEKAVVSACLLGLRCRYDGNHSLSLPTLKMLRDLTAIPVCPEVLGGLPVPRSRAEIIGGSGEDVWTGKARVISEEGYDLTEEFCLGANWALKIAAGARIAVLKSASPSCGFGIIFNGAFQRQTIGGNGVFAALLSQRQLTIISQEGYNNDLRQVK
jgi:uncharacterized protein YbbK (DUF523 family)